MTEKKKRVDITDLASDTTENLSEDDLRKVTGGASTRFSTRSGQPTAADGNDIGVEEVTIVHEFIQRKT